MDIESTDNMVCRSKYGERKLKAVEERMYRKDFELCT